MKKGALCDGDVYYLQLITRKGFDNVDNINFNLFDIQKTELEIRSNLFIMCKVWHLQHQVTNLLFLSCVNKKAVGFIA